MSMQAERLISFPREVLIEDEALRDGLQIEKWVFSVDEKLALISAIADAGVRRIQVGSFVHPKWVPQMANTDELFSRLPPREGVTYSALVLNRAGLGRAIEAGVKHLSISVSASETHSRKNANKSVSDALADIKPTIEQALAAGIAVRAGIQSALGCGYEGSIPLGSVLSIARQYAEIGVREMNVADTAGLANPRQVFEAVTAIGDVVPAGTKLSLHLHDTRGLGLANMYAGLLAGVSTFDAAVGGLGGCPFIPAASGNIATEDAVFALQEMGVETGIDWTSLSAITKTFEQMLGRRLPSRMARLREATDVAARPAQYPAHNDI
jgi:hydroxymethylglutaryl-CoA lyase